MAAVIHMAQETTISCDRSSLIWASSFLISAGGRCDGILARRRDCEIQGGWTERKGWLKPFGDLSVGNEREGFGASCLILTTRVLLSLLLRPRHELDLSKRAVVGFPRTRNFMKLGIWGRCQCARWRFHAKHVFHWVRGRCYWANGRTQPSARDRPERGIRAGTCIERWWPPARRVLWWENVRREGGIHLAPREVRDGFPTAWTL